MANDVNHLISAIRKHDIFRRNDPDAIYAEMDGKPGFYITAVESNRPPRSLGTTNRGRIVQWEEFFKKQRSRGAGGYLKQSGSFLGNCFWCCSPRDHRIKKFLLSTNASANGMLRIPDTYNDEIDLAWVTEKIKFIWAKAFSDRPLPEIVILKETKFYPYPMEEQCRATLGETDFEKALALLQSGNKEGKTSAIETLKSLNDPESIEAIYDSLYRESDWNVLERAIKASIEIGQSVSFHDRLSTHIDGYSTGTSRDYYDDPTERQRWRDVLSQLGHNHRD